MEKLTVIFVHGWSVTNVDTYGAMPMRLRDEAAKAAINIEVREIFLGKYISFHDEVRLRDIALAFQNAIEDVAPDAVAGKKRFVCITHSTGGPVIRDWWHRLYNGKGVCPMSHLVMLAPANYGSALAQLGKGRLGRMKSWFDGVEPGQQVLDWLELGSSEAWQLNRDWILSDGSQIGLKGIFPFVITGQSIDRKLYDNLNTYTGESGSDGVVRVAGANLQASYVRLEQPVPVLRGGVLTTDDLAIKEHKVGPVTPLRVVRGKSHSGDTMGIFKSVNAKAIQDKSSETVAAILACIQVKTIAQYNALDKRFAQETAAVQAEELVEVEKRLLLKPRVFIHDRYAMVIFRVVDSGGYAVKDYDLLITGEGSDPNMLPSGFFVDKQKNRLSPETITYYFNYAMMAGAAEIKDDAGNQIRPTITGINVLGLEIRPRPESGFVRYLPCRIKAGPDLMKKAMTPNGTTLIEICLQRIVDANVFRLDGPIDKMPTTKQGDFKGTKPGNDIVG